MNTQTLTVIIIAIIVILFLYNSNKTQKKSQHHKVNHKIDDDEIAKIQLAFENKLEETYLPDAINGQEIYIYKNLMYPWYNKLTAQYRYDEAKIKKIKEDWIEYMNALQRGHTQTFLALETEDEKQSQEYYNKVVIYSKKVLTIENAFSAAVGKNAEKELEKIRQLSYISDFNRKGEMTPKGYTIDASGKFIPKKK